MKHFYPLILFLTLSVGAEPVGTQPNPLSGDEREILDLTNEARRREGLAPLMVNPVLSKVARTHAANMAKKEVMNHILDGKGPADRVKSEVDPKNWTVE